MSRISVPPAPRHLVQLWRTSGSDVPKSSATAKRLRPAVHLVRSFPTTVPAKPTQTIPARDKVLVSHNMLSHILGFLAVPQAAGVRAVCRYWLRCGSQALHHAILEWFELPLQLSEWGKYPTVSIDMEDSKEPYSQPLHRISHTLLEQRIAFPDWDKEFQWYAQLPRDPFAVDAGPDGPWGMRVRHFYATHCGICGDEKDSKDKSKCAFTSNTAFGESWICTDCVEESTERLSALLADGVPLEALMIPGTGGQWAYWMFRAHDGLKTYERDHFHLWLNDATKLRADHKEKHELATVQHKSWHERRQHVVKQTEQAKVFSSQHLAVLNRSNRVETTKTQTKKSAANRAVQLLRDNELEYVDE